MRASFRLYALKEYGHVAKRRLYGNSQHTPLHENHRLQVHMQGCSEFDETNILQPYTHFCNIKECSLVGMLLEHAFKYQTRQ